VFCTVRYLEQEALIQRASVQVTERTLGALLEKIGQPILLATIEGVVIYANEAASHALGAEGGDMTGLAAMGLRVSDDVKAGFFAMAADLTNSAQNTVAERELLVLDRWWRVYGMPIGSGGEQPTRVLLVGHDMTSMKQRSDESLARERDIARTLVREVDHRMKNHLQGLAGLLRRLDDGRHSVAEVIQAAVGQIMAVASVHRILDGHENARIEIGAVIDEVTRAVGGASFAAEPRQTVLAAAGLHPTYVAQAHAVPLALSLCEMLLNAEKHADSANPARSISCELRASGLCVTVRNRFRAPVAPAGVATERGTSGLALARSLAAIAEACVHTSAEGEVFVARLEIPWSALHDTAEPRSAIAPHGMVVDGRVDRSLVPRAAVPG
jgi:two-component sensor histidine kinase